MDYSLFNSVRCAINKIHQYDESTALRGEVLDEELREVNAQNKAMREKVAELKKQRNQNESGFEDAVLRKQIAKRSCEQKIAMVSCLEAEGERLELVLSKQEKEANSYHEATKQDPLSNIIESFKGMQLQKKSKLDELRSACNEKRKNIEQMKADIEEVTKKGSLLEEMKLSLRSKEANLATSVKINAENQLKIKELVSSTASMSGELQFVKEKLGELQVNVVQLKSSTNADKEKEMEILQEIKKLGRSAYYCS